MNKIYSVYVNDMCSGHQLYILTDIVAVSLHAVVSLHTNSQTYKRP